MYELNMTPEQREYLKSLVRMIYESGETLAPFAWDEAEIMRTVSEAGEITPEVEKKLEGVGTSFGHLVNTWKPWYVYRLKKENT